MRLPREKTLHAVCRSAPPFFVRLPRALLVENLVEKLNFSERRWCRHCRSFSGNQLYIRWSGTRHPGNQENGGEACWLCLSISSYMTKNLH